MRSEAAAEKGDAQEPKPKKTPVVRDVPCIHCGQLCASRGLTQHQKVCLKKAAAAGAREPERKRPTRQATKEEGADKAAKAVKGANRGKEKAKVQHASVQATTEDASAAQAMDLSEDREAAEQAGPVQEEAQGDARAEQDLVQRGAAGSSAAERKPAQALDQAPTTREPLGRLPPIFREKKRKKRKKGAGKDDDEQVVKKKVAKVAKQSKVTRQGKVARQSKAAKQSMFASKVATGLCDTVCRCCGFFFNKQGIGSHEKICSAPWMQATDVTAGYGGGLAAERATDPSAQEGQADAPGEPDCKRPAYVAASSEDKPAQASDEASLEESEHAPRGSHAALAATAPTVPSQHGIYAILHSGTEPSPDQDAPQVSPYHSFEVNSRTQHKFDF